MKIELTVEGVETLKARMQAIGEDAKTHAGNALYLEAEKIMGASKERYVPVDTGVLRASGFVRPPQIDGEVVSVAMGYGGAAKAYAIVQHERLDYKHAVGGAKYLERPLFDAAPSLAYRIAEKLREMFK